MITYLVQCKCFNRKHKVGPNIVRELSGSMSIYGKGCKGIIITTSKFTKDAEDERLKLLKSEENKDITFIDGEDFAKQILN